MSNKPLVAYTSKELSQMAKRQGIAGWHSMRKAELLEALSHGSSPRKEPLKAAAHPRAKKGNHSASSRQAKAKLQHLHQRLAKLKDLATTAAGKDLSGSLEEDRLVLVVRDPFWLQAHWEITPASVERARIALGQDWHSAQPVLRVHRIDEGGTSTSYREIAIHGDSRHWYIDVQNPPSSYRAEIGYSVPGRVYRCLCRSGDVTTPAPGSPDATAANLRDMAENADHLFALSGGYSEEGANPETQQLLEVRRQSRLGRPTDTRFSRSTFGQTSRKQALPLAIDAEVVIYGVTDPHAHVTIEGQLAKPQQDGTFTLRLPFPDRRQVIPIVASAADGREQKTVVLGIERNTKELDLQSSETRNS